MTSALPHRHEFDCAECGRHIIRYVATPPEPPLCGPCVMFPAWFRDAGLRFLLDPTHDGREVIDRSEFHPTPFGEG